jgi:hypothetical protein
MAASTLREGMDEEHRREEASPRGKSGAYPQTLRKLASALGVAPEELLHGESAQR